MSSVVQYICIFAGYGVIKTSRDLRYAVDSVIYVKVNVSDGRNVVGPFTVTVRLRSKYCISSVRNSQ